MGRFSMLRGKYNRDKLILNMCIVHGYGFGSDENNGEDECEAMNK